MLTVHEKVSRILDAPAQSNFQMRLKYFDLS